MGMGRAGWRRGGRISEPRPLCTSVGVLNWSALGMRGRDELDTTAGGGLGRGRRERAVMFMIPICGDSVVLGLEACR